MPQNVTGTKKHRKNVERNKINSFKSDKAEKIFITARRFMYNQIFYFKMHTSGTATKIIH